jgi:hypothetical protein
MVDVMVAVVLVAVAVHKVEHAVKFPSAQDPTRNGTDLDLSRDKIQRRDFQVYLPLITITHFLLFQLSYMEAL